MKLNMANCVLLGLLLLGSLVLLKCTNSPLVINFLNFVQLFHLQERTFNYNFACFLCDLLSPLFPNNFRFKDTFSFISQIKNANLFKNVIFSYDLTSVFTSILLQRTIDIAIILIFSHNLNLNITRKELKMFSYWLHHRLILFLTVSFIIESMEQPWVLPQFLSLLKFPWISTNLSGLTNII